MFDRAGRTQSHRLHTSGNNTDLNIFHRPFLNVFRRGHVVFDSITPRRKRIGSALSFRIRTCAIRSIKSPSSFPFGDRLRTKCNLLNERSVYSPELLSTISRRSFNLQLRFGRNYTVPLKLCGFV